MVGYLLGSHKRFFICIAAAVKFFCLVVVPEKAYAGFDVDTALFNLSLKTIKISLNVALKTIVSSPKMIALILSLYFYKEIFEGAKKIGCHVIGKYPRISFLAGLGVLLYALADLE